MTERASTPLKSTVVSAPVNRQARQRLFRGLERFANTGDTMKEYRAFGTAWRDFWPFDFRDGQNNPLRWPDSGHGLFLLWRNALRGLWISDPYAIHTDALSFLMGIGGQFEHLSKEGGRRDFHPLGIVPAWETLTQDHPDVRVIAVPVVYPHWKRGEFTYSPQNDFQNAVYLLFRESWRAKVCASCSTYFIAQKPAQLYCSSRCSNAAHLAQALKHWRAKGAARRAAKRNGNPVRRKRK
jgi:hypothetical protein